MIIEYLKPFGFSIATLLVLGGPQFYRDVHHIVLETFTESNPNDFRSRLTLVRSAQKELLRINWRGSAPVVFCNEFAIGYNRQTQRCDRN